MPFFLSFLRSFIIPIIENNFTYEKNSITGFPSNKTVDFLFKILRSLFLVDQWYLIAIGHHSPSLYLENFNKEVMKRIEK